MKRKCGAPDLMSVVFYFPQWEDSQADQKEEEQKKPQKVQKTKKKQDRKQDQQKKQKPNAKPLLTSPKQLTRRTTQQKQYILRGSNENTKDIEYVKHLELKNRKRVKNVENVKTSIQTSLSKRQKLSTALVTQMDWPTTFLSPVMNNIWYKLNTFQSLQVPKQPHNKEAEKMVQKIIARIYTQALSQGVQIPPGKKEWNLFLTILYSFPKLQCSVLNGIYDVNLDPFLSLAHYVSYLPSKQQDDMRFYSTTIRGTLIPPRPWSFQLGKYSFTENMEDPLFLQLCLFASDHKKILHFEQWKDIPWENLAFSMLTKCFLGEQIPLQAQFVVSKEVIQEPLSKFALQLFQTLFKDGEPICIAEDKFHIGQMFSKLKVPTNANGFGKEQIWILRHCGEYVFVTFPRQHCITYIPSTTIIPLDWEHAVEHFFTRPNIHFVATHKGKSIIAFTGRGEIQYKIISYKKTQRMQSIQLLIVNEDELLPTLQSSSKYKIVKSCDFKEPDRADSNRYLVLCNEMEAKKWKRQLPETPIFRLITEKKKNLIEKKKDIQKKITQ